MITRSKSKQASILNMPLNRTPIEPIRGSQQPNVNDVSLLDLEVEDLNRSIGLDNPNSNKAQNPINSNTENLDERISRVATSAVSSALTDMMQNLTLSLTNKFETMFQQNQFNFKQQPARTSSPSFEDNCPEYSQNNRKHFSNFPTTSKNVSNNSYDKSKVASNISRWNLRFDGDKKKMSVNQFIFRVSKLQQSYGYSEDQIFDNFHLLIEGQVQNWYWNYSSSHPFLNYHELLNALKIHYGSSESEFELNRKLNEVRQRETDSFEYFYNEVLRRNALLQTAKSDSELAQIVIHNVKPSIRQMIFNPLNETKTLDEIVSLCKSAENLIKNNINCPKPRPSINEIENTETICSQCNSIDAFDKNPRHREEYQCKNCALLKHPRRETLHCFKCGLDNTISSDCPRCKSNQN